MSFSRLLTQAAYCCPQQGRDGRVRPAPQPLHGACVGLVLRQDGGSARHLRQRAVHRHDDGRQRDGSRPRTARRWLDGRTALPSGQPGAAGGCRADEPPLPSVCQVLRRRRVALPSLPHARRPAAVLHDVSQRHEDQREQDRDRRRRV